MPIKACQGCLKDQFLTTTEAIDCFTGKQLWAWGARKTYNRSAGGIGDNVVISRSSPVQTISSGTNWKHVSASHGSSFAIKQDGTLWVWGDNLFGHLGTNNLVSVSSPVQTVSGGTNWKQVSAGAAFLNSSTGAIKTDGTLWMWGGNLYGVLGDGSVIRRSSPVQTVSGGTDWKNISVGYSHTAAIKTDGALWLWGYNTYGRLGTNNTIHRSSPVQTISGGTNWKSASVGSKHTAAIKTDGTLWLWGQGASGQLGNNDRACRLSPVQTVSGGANWKQVSAGSVHTAAVKTDGSLWTWGLNLLPYSTVRGQLGDNTVISRSSPVQTVSGGTNWRSTSANRYTTAAIKTDGTLWMWGGGGLYAFGLLGDNAAIISRSSPIQTVSGGTSWKEVSTGYTHTLAIKEVEF